MDFCPHTGGHMTNRIAFNLAAGLTILLGMVAGMLPLPLHAQQFFGSIVGTVTDTSGAIIPGATVTLTNVGTNEKHIATANAAGNYQFVNLVPATYRVEVNQANF